MSRRLAAAIAIVALTGPGSAGVALSEPKTATDRGRILMLKCVACHSLHDDGMPKLGPHLEDLNNRTAGSLEGYDYSDALRESGVVWTIETLDAWLADPAGLVPQNKMAFVGMRDADDRLALVRYLLEASESAP